MKRILINATQTEEIRVALVDGQKLYDLDIESGYRAQKKANIYKGKITRIEPSLEAAFVEYGSERHGFLPLKEIAREYYTDPNVTGRVNIKDILKEGTEVIVQVDKEERGNKGAALTSMVSLAGRYLVLMPNNPKAGGISRRIEGDDRAQLRQALQSVVVPEGMGIIVRTAGIDRTSEELQWDLDYLVQLWESITAAAAEKQAPFLILQESNVILRAIRDYLRQDIGEVLIDRKEVFDYAMDFVQKVMPSYQSKIRLYNESVPLFNRYQIETQIETAFQREVKLPSGGSIVIDPTEALVSIDINSSRATKGSDIEETALNTNLEAAEEIARQLRLRDMGGLIVIDFIDMSHNKNQRDVENRLKEATEADRARVQIGRISRFGLLEMSRQRLRPSLEESSGHVCPRCNGQGVIRDVKSLALAILRLVEEESLKDRTAQIRAIVPVSVATYLLNEKRHAIAELETRLKINVIVIPNPNMETPHYEVVRLRDDNEIIAEGEPSFAIQLEETTSEAEMSIQPPAKVEKAAVSAVSVSSKPAPVVEKPVQTSPGLLAGLFSAIGKMFAPKAPEPKPARQAKSSGERSPRPRRDDSNQGRGKKPSNRNSSGTQSNSNRPKKQSKPRPPRDNAESAEVVVDENGAKTTEARRQNRDKYGNVPSDEKGRNRRRRSPSQRTRRPESDEVSEATAAATAAVVDTTNQAVEVVVAPTAPVVEKTERAEKTESVSVDAPQTDTAAPVTAAPAESSDGDVAEKPAHKPRKTSTRERKPRGRKPAAKATLDGSEQPAKESTTTAEAPAAKPAAAKEDNAVSAAKTETVKAAPAAEKAVAAEPAKVEAVEKKAAPKAEKPAPAKKETPAVVASEPAKDTAADTKQPKKRAYNDPREVKRRELEAAKNASE